MVGPPPVLTPITPIELGIAPVTFETAGIPLHIRAITPQFTSGCTAAPVLAQFAPALFQLAAALAELPLVATELGVSGSTGTPIRGGRRDGRDGRRRGNGWIVLRSERRRGEADGQQGQEEGAGGLHAILECRCRSVDASHAVLLTWTIP